MPNIIVQVAAEGLPTERDIINEDGTSIDTPRERLDYHAREFARAALYLDPLATEALVGEGVGDSPHRYSVIVSRK